MEDVHVFALGPRDLNVLLAASRLFDHPVNSQWAQRFLSADGHHLLLAATPAGRAVGFVSGIEMTHPDKGTEMFVYELVVDEDYRGRGVGQRLVTFLCELAARRGCYGAWVVTDENNASARRLYRMAGAGETARQVVAVWDWRDEDLPDQPTSGRSSATR